MCDKRIQWHPGFVAAMGLELSADRENLVYEKEHNLNTKPLEIDLLVIKKAPKARISSGVGRIFRGHNILEYKSPGDHLDIDTFYKVGAYAGLYKSYGSGVDARRADDITVSIIREGKPSGLFRYFKEKGVAVAHPASGIYYIKGEVLFPTQVIVIRELDRKEHLWLRALSGGMGVQEMKELIGQVGSLTEKWERELADSVLEVSVRANRETMEELRRDEGMCQALLEIMKPEINEIVEAEARKREQRGLSQGISQGFSQGVSQGLIQGISQGISQGLSQGLSQGIRGTVRAVRSLGHGDLEIKKIIMEQYGLSDEEAGEYL